MSEADTVLRTIVLVVAVVLLFPIIMMVVFMPVGMLGWGGTMHGWDGFTGTGFLVWIFFLAIALGIGYLLYSAAGTDSGSDPALEELRAAYARGEVDTEEFEERKRRLEK